MNKKYDFLEPSLSRTLQGLFGTPKHAFTRLRLAEVGFDAADFYRVWRYGRVRLFEHQALRDMIDVWWENKPSDPDEFAIYEAPFTPKMIAGWRVGLTLTTIKGTDE